MVRNNAIQLKRISIVISLGVALRFSQFCQQTFLWLSFSLSLAHSPSVSVSFSRFFVHSIWQILHKIRLNGSNMMLDYVRDWLEYVDRYTDSHKRFTHTRTHRMRSNFCDIRYLLWFISISQFKTIFSVGCIII